MTPERWQQIEPILEAALALPIDERAAYLQQACNGDETLRAEVMALLAQEESADEFLEAPILPLPDKIKQLMETAAGDASSSDSTQAITEQQLGAYQIISLLGKGGMGEVHLARDTKLDREVAIKLLPPMFARDSERVARFKREARMLARLNNHPNIAVIHALEQSEQTPFLVLEYVPGDTLADRLQQGTLPLTQAVPIFQQIAEALIEAHQQGVVHRDLKPANIKITPEGRVKVLDFGLAKLLRNDEAVEIASPDNHAALTRSYWTTERQLILGTAPYMSPEQTYGHKVDHRSDIWAFGCVLFEALSGQRPFKGIDTLDTLNAIRTREPDWSLLPADLPPTIRRLLQQCLQKDPQQRLASAREARAILEQGNNEISASSLLTKLKRWEKPLAIAAAVILFVALSVAFRHQIQAFFTPTSAPAVNSLPTEKSLVVLPFKDAGNNVGAGFARTLQEMLAKIPELQVLPAAEAAQADLTSAEPARILRTLGVGLLLSGEVTRDGENISINFWLQNSQAQQLINETITGHSNEYFKLQSELATKVAKALQANLTSPPTFISFKNQSSDEKYLAALSALQSDLTKQTIEPLLRSLRELGQQEPDSARVYAALSRASFLKAQLTNDFDVAEEAVRLAEQAVKLDPQAPEVQIISGQALYFLERYDDAIKAFQQARNQQPGNLSAMLGLARAYEDTDRAQEAEAQYNAAVTHWPNYWGGYNERGAFYFAQGKLEQALREWETVIRLNTDGASGYVNMGNAHVKLRNYQQAENAYRMALEHLSNDQQTVEEAYVGWGATQYYQGRYEDAAKSFQAGLSWNNKSVLLWANAGDALFHQAGKEQEAFDAYQQAITITQKNQPGALGLARLAEYYAKRSRIELNDGKHQTTDKQKALYFIRQSLNRAPNNPEALLSSIFVYHLTGDQAKALEQVALTLQQGIRPSELEAEPDLQPLRLNARYAEIVKPFLK